MAKKHEEFAAAVPMRRVGPIRLAGPAAAGDVMAPLATFETPLWPSVDRGAAVTRAAGGIRVVIADERMTRSILLEAPSAAEAVAAAAELGGRAAELDAVARRTSRFARLIGQHTQIVGRLLYLRLEFSTGDAAGHNMVTKAADAIMEWILRAYPALAYGSISANYCADKKASAVNGILGRGKYVVAETTIPARLCRRFLKTSPEKMVELNVRKNLLGSILAGGVRTANAHFANMLLAFYLATGQDGANVVEGSQGVVHAEAQPGADGGALYFSVTVPNVIVGAVGSGKDLPFVQANLADLGCAGEAAAPGAHARRLAAIAGAVVLCGELSLLAAQTNPGELMRAHLALERKGGPRA
jgi:hydroxymethylglutaryl-CoA reductase (NADPH)